MAQRKNKPQSDSGMDIPDLAIERITRRSRSNYGCGKEQRELEEWEKRRKET